MERLDSSERQLKHLEFLQLVIGRMGTNSVAVKTFCVTLSGAVLAVTIAAGKPMICYFSMPLVVLFALLDAQYLNLERGFRNKYDFVRKSDPSDVDFSINPTWESKTPYQSALFSWSVIWFYIPVLALMAIVAAFAGGLQN